MERKNKTTAALLALFLGGFGAHLYYLERTNRGLLYNFVLLIAFVTMVYADFMIGMVICWGIGLAAFIDFVYLLTMGDVKFNNEYNEGVGDVLMVDKTDELKKLFELKEMGAITEDEYNLKKRDLLS